MPDPAPVTSATRVASGLGFGHPRELGLLERPVLDAELLGLVDRHVGADRLGAAHHVDRVDVELPRHARGLLVLAEREHPHARAPARSPGPRRGSPGCPGSRCGRSSPGSPPGTAACSSLSRPTTSSTGASRRQVHDQRLDLGAQEVVRAGRAQLGQRGQRARGTRSPARRRSRCSGRPAACPSRPARGSPAPARPHGPGAPRREAGVCTTSPNGCGPAASFAAMNASAVRTISSDRSSASSDVSPQAVMPCPPRMQPMACGFASLIAAMSSPSWNPGRRHGTHTTESPKHLRGQRLAVGGRRERDARVRVQVVHVRRVDQRVHRRVDRRRRTALAVQAVVERRDHLVLALDARVHVDQRAQPVQAQHREVLLRQRAQVTARALDPEQLDVRARDRVRRACPSRRCSRPRSWWSAGPPRACWTVRPALLRRSCSPSRLVAADALGDDLLRVPRRLVRPDRVGVEALRLPQVREQRPDVRVVGVHDQAVGAEHVTGRLRRQQRVGVDQQRLRRGLLHVHDRADLPGDLRLDVVALVEHEVDAASRVPGRPTARSRA